MRNSPGSTLFIIFILVVFVYLAFFGFNISAAWNYTVVADGSFLKMLGF